MARSTREVGDHDDDTHDDCGAKSDRYAIATEARFGEALAVSGAMRQVFAHLEKAAQAGITILLEGESGVGKEILARAVHAASTRAEGPFVVVDCGALPATLIESELFGHERGAFTGAQSSRTGMFEQADGGTLFLDEIGELPLELQPKLLRVLEQRVVRPLGAPASRPVDIRVVAATNRRLTEALAAGRFRSDLYYRLAVALVSVPPLRDRLDDVPLLARRFLRRALGDDQAELPDELFALFASHDWPGNVRELRNVVERYAVFGAEDERILLGSDRATALPGEDLSHLPFHEARRIALQRFENDYLPRVLARAGGVVTRAAQLAEVARPSFYRMLDRHRSERTDS